MIHSPIRIKFLYTAFGAMYNAPILLSVGSNIGALYQKLYVQSKGAPADGRVCRPKHVELI